MTGYLVVAVLGLIVVGAVAYPLLAGVARYDEPETLERDVARYRAAVDAGTVCPRCRRANPPDSRFCAECGRPLRVEDE